MSPVRRPDGARAPVYHKFRFLPFLFHLSFIGLTLCSAMICDSICRVYGDLGLGFFESC